MFEHETIQDLITEDPLAHLPVGKSIPVEPIAFGGTDATVVPQGAIKWTFFEGALLMVIVRTADSEVVVGSAVVLAPGLAVTATHVFADVLPDLVQGAATLFCVGPATAGAEMWHVRKISQCATDDIAYLSIALGSSISATWRFRTIAVSTRTPKRGEKISVVGFKFPTVVRESTNSARFYGNLYIAAGAVTNVYHPMRDRVLMPYPTIEVACGSLGGMSGGAMLDSQGYLTGVISRGWETDDQVGPSYAAWIVGGLNRDLEISWPPGLYSQPIHILKIDEHILKLEGRERVTVVNNSTTEFEVWFDR